VNSILVRSEKYVMGKLTAKVVRSYIKQSKNKTKETCVSYVVIVVINT